MPSVRPMTNSGCGVGPVYSRPTAIELVAVEGDAPAGPPRTRAPRGRRSRRRRTAGPARGTRASSARSSSGGRPPRSGGRGRRWPSGASAGGRRRDRRAPAARRRSRAAATAVGQRRSSYGGREHALVGDDPGDELGRRDVERRVADVGVGRGDALAADDRTSSALRSSIGMAAPSGVARSTDAHRARRRRTGCRGGRPARPACTSRPCWPCRRWRRSGPPRR